MKSFADQEYLVRVVDAMAMAVAGLAVVIGGVGMTNTLFMSVFERTTEIGVLRALGWRRRRVLALILQESLVLSLLGGLAGVVFGALDRPTSGEVWVNGQNLARIRDLDTFRARTVGFVFQLHNLIPTLTARENVEVPMMGQPVGRRERRRRAEELLERVGLRDRMNHLPNQMSGGERQRVAIARALANNPALLLADEPTGNLDSQSGAEVVALMRALNRDLGTTIIIVTHDPSVARRADRILLMRDGRIVKEMTGEAMTNEPMYQ